MKIKIGGIRKFASTCFVDALLFLMIPTIISIRKYPIANQYTCSDKPKSQKSKTDSSFNSIILLITLSDKMQYMKYKIKKSGIKNTLIK